MRRTYILSVIAIILASLSTAAHAQDAGNTDSDDSIEEIIVTGSRIARRDNFSNSPIYTFDDLEIAISGTNEIYRLLNELPQIDPGANAGANNEPFGSARVNLRSLGDARTLVLLNGRRFAQNGIFGSVDLNALPPVLIDRVEVISGGASAVYGSDAVAGAINFILKNDFDGFESSFQYDVSQEGDGDIYNFDIAYGTPFADGRGNIALFGNYLERTTVFQDARDFSRVALTSDDDTGEIISDDSFISGAGAIDGVQDVNFYTFDADGVPRLFVDPDDRFSLTPTDALQAPMERYSLNALGHYDFTNSVRAIFELNYAHSQPEQHRPDSWASFVDVNVDRPDITQELRDLLAADYDPDQDGIATIGLLRRFTPEAGEAVRINERDFIRVVGGVEGDIGERWRWSADVSYSKTDLDMRVINDNSRSRIQQGMLVDPVTGDCFDTSGGCVPVNPFGPGNVSAAAVDFIGLDDTTADEDRSEQIFNATLRGPLAEIWAGDLDVAFGAEYRRDETNSLPGENIANGESLFSSPRVPTSGTVTVKEVFAEAIVPLIDGSRWAQYLGLELGVRYSDYNIIDDGLWTWKAGGEWQINDSIRVRSMWQRAIRAPGPSEIFQSPTFAGNFFFLGPFFDQCSASRDPVGNGLADLCIEQGLDPADIGVFEAGFFPSAVTFSSNPDLQAEEADTFTAGIVWQPDVAAGLSISADYFDIEIDNGAGLLFPDDAMTLCFLTRDINDKFCQSFSRGPSGDVDQALITFINVAVVQTSGIDVSINYGWDADSFGLFGNGANFDWSFVSTHYIEAGSQASPLVSPIDCAGKFGSLCSEFIYLGALPELRINSRLTYSTGPFAASLRWQYIDGMINSEPEIRELTNRPPPVMAVPEVGSHSYFDLTLESDMSDHWNLRFGITNLFNKEPPFLGSANISANTDPRTYDILGRRFFLRLTANY